MLSLNLTVRALLELCALAALGYWGVVTGDGLASSILLAIVAPLAAAIVWGLFVAPKAPYAPGGFVRLVVEVVIFAAAAGALLHAGQPVLAVLLASTYGINRVLLSAYSEGYG